MGTPTRAATANIWVRPANSADLPQVVDLVLTSFRQFPLFDYLYAPLRTNLDGARDTRFYWRRRFQLAMLQPGATVLVAETNAPLPAASELQARRKDVPDYVKESWRMLNWIETQQTPDIQPLEGKRQVCGWAVWMVRKGSKDGQTRKDLAGSRQRWWAWIRSEYWQRDITMGYSGIKRSVLT